MSSTPGVGRSAAAAPCPSGLEDEHQYVVKHGGRSKFMNPLAVLKHFWGLKGESGFGSRATASSVARECQWDGKGKVAIVTGPYTGIGRETARCLASSGAEVILAGRQKGKEGERRAKDFEEEIRQAHPGAKVKAMHLDLSSLASVKQFSKQFLASGRKLNILVNNAGVMACPFTLSKDGYEMQFATNHLGHFYLTKLLLKNLVATDAASTKASASGAGGGGGGGGGRIVNLTSSAHFSSYRGGLLSEDQLHKKESYSEWHAYGQSKLCNLLFTRELNSRLKELYPQSNITCVGVHPGVIATDLQKHIHLPFLVKKAAHLLTSPFLKSIPQGAATTVYGCISNEVKAGEFYCDCNTQESHPYSKDRKLGRKLWEISEKYCKKFEDES